MGVSNTVSDWFGIGVDGAVDVAEAAANSPSAFMTPYADQVAAQAASDGALAARVDWSNQQLQDAAMSGLDDGSMAAAYRDRFSPVDAVPAEDINIPFSASPWQTAMEVALTPTIANAGEGEYLQGRQDYVGGYSEAYREEAIRQAEQNLQERFALPESAWRDPWADQPTANMEPPAPPPEPISMPDMPSIPLFDYSPPAMSSGSYDNGGSYDSGGGSYDSGSSSGSSSE